MIQVVLDKKIKLTHDVFELHYKLSEEKTMLPGQFITFILPGIGGRSYSILRLINSTVILIIKRWEKVDGGRGGSILLCDADIGEAFQAVGPAGHFILSDINCSRLFLGTGTGFVPLYSQILGTLKQGNNNKIHFCFGVRTFNDMFYTHQLEKISQEYPNFSYTLYLSRDESENTIKGYVTDFLSQKNIGNFREFYMCGAPAMIESCEKRLLELGVKKDCIYFEKYS